MEIWLKILLLVSFTLIAYFAVVRSLVSLAPWVPTSKEDFERVNKLSGLNSGEVFLEAGCGDARVAEYIARNNPEAQVVAMELSIIMFLWAKLKALKSGLKNLTVVYGDVLRANFGQYDVVYSFALTRTINQKLMPKIKSEMKSRGRFLSYAFVIKDENNTETDLSETSSNIHVYKQP